MKSSQAGAPDVFQGPAAATSPEHVVYADPHSSRPPGDPLHWAWGLQKPNLSMLKGLKSESTHVAIIKLQDPTYSPCYSQRMFCGMMRARNQLRRASTLDLQEM